MHANFITTRYVEVSFGFSTQVSIS